MQDTQRELNSRLWPHSLFAARVGTAIGEAGGSPAVAFADLRLLSEEPARHSLFDHHADD
jgi:hypothetical protein